MLGACWMLDGTNQSILSVKTHRTDVVIYPASPAQPSLA